MRSKLQGFTVEDVEPGRGRPEASTESEEKTENATENPAEGQTENRTGCETEKEYETKSETKNLARVPRWKRVTCVKNR